MAAYFHGSSEIQADSLQTLYLMNPNYISAYSDTQPPPNMLFLNSQAPPPHTQHFVGIPLPTASATSGPPNSDEIPTPFTGIAPRFHYNLWGPDDQNTTATGSHPQFPPPPAVTINSCGGPTNVEPFNRQTTQQGLSLSLSSEQPGYRQPPVAVISPRGGEGSSSVSGVSNGNFGMQSLILGSKYLKVAQQLLDEVVSVGDHVVKAEEMKEMLKVNNYNNINKESMAVSPGEGLTGGKRRSELTTAEKQEFQMKKAKLVSMLDEVEQRYRQYHQQMQIVVTSFEQAAGLGSAKSYTALALQTISKQFRCLKDAISAQIKATSKSLGEDEICLTGKVEGSRLKFVDHQIRQQRALQQLGMMQQNAWRPQRGLPERAVSVLRAWLFEHFLHPYPKDSDKHMLAKQTGLTRSQVFHFLSRAASSSSRATAASAFSRDAFTWGFLANALSVDICGLRRSVFSWLPCLVFFLVLITLDKTFEERDLRLAELLADNQECCSSYYNLMKQLNTSSNSSSSSKCRHLIILDEWALATAINIEDFIDDEDDDIEDEESEFESSSSSGEEMEFDF